MVALDTAQTAAMSAFLKARRGDKEFLRAHPGAAGTHVATPNLLVRVVLSGTVTCGRAGCGVFRCVCDPAVAPPTRAYRGAWIRSSQPKDVAEATVQARQRPARSVLPSVVGCLPQCYYTRSETEFSLAL